jgi:hypothetical protein
MHSWDTHTVRGSKSFRTAAWQKDFDAVAQDLTEKGIDFLIKKFSVRENVVVPV